MLNGLFLLQEGGTFGLLHFGFNKVRVLRYPLFLTYVKEKSAPARKKIRVVSA